MKKMIRSAIQKRKITLFMVLFAFIFGLHSYYVTPKQESPDVNVPYALITAVYPGASPEDVEEFVTSKIEDAIVDIKGYKQSQSTSSNSVSVVVLELDRIVDAEKAWDDLREKMDDLQVKLPSQVEKINVNTNTMETAGMIISMSGEAYSYEQLEEYAKKFKKELTQISGVSRFEITGKQDKEITVEVDAEQLNFYDLSLEEVSQIIQTQNIEIPSGYLEGKAGKVNVISEGKFESVDDIKNLIVGVSSKNGVVVRLKDIADIRFSDADSDYKIKHNGENAVLLTGYFEKSKNIIIVGKDVETRLNELKKDLPEDIHFEQVLYQPTTVSNSVNDFVSNLLQGILFVIVVVFIGMGFRNAIIVSTAIPVSILMTFISMRLLEIQIHQISIAALIVALGMLVDNAIVVSDSIQVKLDCGEDRLQSCVEGTKELAIPMLTSTLTTIAAFFPFMLLNSDAGAFIKTLPQIIIVSLIASYIVALFVTPTMAYIFFRPSPNKEGRHRVQEIFEHLLEMGMKRKRVAIVIAMVFVIGAGSLIGRLGLEFFPKADTDVIYINIDNDKSADITSTEELTERVSTILAKQPEVVSYTAGIGDGLPKFYYTMDPSTPAKTYAQMMVRLDLPKGERFETNKEFVDFIQQEFDTKVAGGTATANLLEQGVPVSAPISIRVIGENREDIQRVTDQLKKILVNIEGTMNVTDDLGTKQYEFYVNVDEDMASYYGITKFDVQQEVSLALRGMDASTFTGEGNENDIRVTSDISTKEELENFGIKSSITGNKVLLKQIADVSLKAQSPEIKKYAGEMCATVNSDVKSGYNSVVLEEQLRNELAEMDLTGVKIEYEGEGKSIRDNFGSVGVLAIVALLFVYLILMVQFYSFLQPIIILFTIPFSLVGSIAGLFLFRQPLSFTALLGVVSLMGIVVNNAIVLLDFINKERTEGKSIETACKDAIAQRFRPIMLSTTTTVIGLIPLVYSSSELFRPLSIALMSGLMISTLLTLVMIPIIYSMVENLMISIRKKMGRKNNELSAEA